MLLVSPRFWRFPLLAPAFVCACSAAGSSDPIVVGSEGTGGASNGAGGAMVLHVPDGGSARELSVRVEQDHLTITLVTIACAGDCVDVEAVAAGGYAPYQYLWEDGSTDPRRHLCPAADGAFRVTATDAGSDSPEFHRPPSTATAEVSAHVLDCTAADAGSGGAPPIDSGTGNAVYWTNWKTVTPGAPGSASGVVTLPGGDVTVTFGGELGSATETEAGTVNNWAPPATYESAAVPNRPPNAGQLAVSGASGEVQKIFFSEPVRNPVIAVWSLGFGSLGQSSTWSFSAPVTLRSTGVNASWPFSGNLTVQGTDVTGVEGNGVLEFTGTFSSLSFSIPVPENAPGYGTFTVGIRGRN